MIKLNSNTRLVAISSHADAVSFLSNSQGSRSYWLYLSGTMFNKLKGSNGGSRGIVMNVNSNLANIIILDFGSMYGRYDITQSKYISAYKFDITVTI